VTAAIKGEKKELGPYIGKKQGVYYQMVRNIKAFLIIYIFY